MNLGPGEILVICVVALLVFGPQRLPELARQVGAAMRELRRWQDTVRTELREALDEASAGASGTAAVTGPPSGPVPGAADDDRDHPPPPAAPPPAAPPLQPDRGDGGGFAGPPNGSFR
jgi:Tat protein translocase TatB subunit